MARTTRSACWPTAEQDALLRAALLDGDDARAAWRTWERTAGFPEIDEGSVRLLPLVYRNLTRLGVSSPLTAELKGVHRRSWYKNQVLFEEVARVLSALHGAGILTVLLKGVPLALTCYPDEACRPMADVDVLVRPTDTGPALRVLRAAGWQPSTDPPAWPAEPRNAWTFVDREARQLDLHWRVFRVGYASDDELWAAAEALEVRGVRTLALCPTDQLLHVIAHGIVWNPVPSIRWIADATLLVRARGPAIDWDRLLAEGQRRGLLLTLERGLRYLADRTQVPVPTAVLDRLGARPSGRRERAALWAQMQPGVTAGMLRIWFDYTAYERGRGAHAGPLRFLRYLSAFWKAESPRSVPAMILDRIRHRLQ
ncbi:MAG: nucleotidyltransferase family protein [Acidobacteria bacterium]|nr:nucleotidyltransferase family protein [Acidobacteriota bacterium]